MELKNANLTSERMFEITTNAGGTDCEYIVKELINIICDMSDDITVLKANDNDIKKLVEEFPNDFDLGNAIREKYKL